MSADNRADRTGRTDRMDPMGRPAGSAAAGLHRVEMLCDLERWAEARGLLGPLLAADPENHTAWCLLARCHLGLDQSEQALIAAHRAASLAPDEEWPHRLSSFATSKLGRHDEAVKAAREAVRLEPSFWQTHARLAGAAGQHALGKDEAVRAAEWALALAPNEPQVQLIYGSIAASQGRREVAERAYRKALELDPQSSGAHHLLAALQLRRRTGLIGLARAATGFATALSTDPTAQVSRHSLELTLRVFLGRAAYFLFVTAYLGQFFAGRSALPARAIPVLLLALPVLFIVAFLRRLSPQLRTFLRQLLRRRATSVAAALELGSVVLVLAGVTAPQPVRPALAIAAAVLALIARLVLYPDTRQLFRS
jgi:tetratricopeptide (TPR) repeat protein